MAIFPSSSLPKWFLNPSTFLAHLVINILFHNRDQLGKEFWLTNWCLRATLYETVIQFLHLACPRNNRISFLLFHTHLYSHFHIYDSILSLLSLLGLTELFLLRWLRSLMWYTTALCWGGLVFFWTAAESACPMNARAPVRVREGQRRRVGIRPLPHKLAVNLARLNSQN